MAVEEEKYDFSSVSYIEPNPEKPLLFAKSKDYCVIMHFSEDIRHMIVSNKFDNSNV